MSTVVKSEEELLSKVTEYSHEIGYVFIGAGILIVSFLIYKGMKKPA
ncbi:alkaline phosphatase like protein [Bacteroides pyogenes DSM 20611 = JCM 6294]|uniref:Alkaline phosphatase like protein n=1 Tax=Bacteroides pyogenes DSM 20611 = JCM 6294 TaxID=1121100 RepID=W4PFF4_9BACE|nr:alkaline phosphatase like protein [Bacteroides pyogenes DSM 20611 = JCM 6294]